MLNNFKILFFMHMSVYTNQVGSNFLFRMICLCLRSVKRKIFYNLVQRDLNVDFYHHKKLCRWARTCQASKTAFRSHCARPYGEASCPNMLPDVQRCQARCCPTISMIIEWAATPGNEYVLSSRARVSNWFDIK